MKTLELDQVEHVTGGNALDTTTGSFSTFNSAACASTINSYSGLGSFVGGLLGAAFGGAGASIGSFAGWGGGSVFAMRSKICMR